MNLSTVRLLAAHPRALNLPLIRLQDVTISYDRRPAVHHLSGAFEAGSMTAIVGPNGAGKTTLLRAIMGLQSAEGSLVVEGARRGDIAYLPQQSELDRQFPLTVYDLALMGHWPRAGAFRSITRAQRASASAALAAVGLAGLDDRPVSTLSAGQLQRAMFARVLVQDARVLLLDEPFNAIDSRTTEDLLDIVARWHQERRTILCVLHDLELVRSHFPRTLLIACEPVAWGPTAEALSPANLLRARAMAERRNEDGEYRARRA
ncbi:MAG: metal ABC transporter ATP-binding protein [Alphaproteobacteria bacterium]